MGTAVVAGCPEHGRLVLNATQVTLTLFLDEPDRSYYRFPCPQCPELVIRPASPAHFHLLRPLGSTVLTIETGTGPALTLDDLADFHDSIRHIDHLVPFCARNLSEH